MRRQCVVGWVLGLGLLLAASSAGCATLPDVEPRCDLATGALVISEVYPLPEQGAAWIELHNRGLEPLELDGLVLRRQWWTEDGESRDTHHVLFGAGRIAPGGHVVLSGEQDGAFYSYNVDGVGRLGAFRDGPHGLALECGGEVLDEVRWNEEPTALATQPGVSLSRGIWDDWCPGKVQGGSPEALNPPCNTCMEGRHLRVREAPRPGDLTVTEVLLNPLGVDKSAAAGTNRFWVEVLAQRAVDIEDVVLVTVFDGQEDAFPLVTEGCGRVEAGEHVLVGGVADQDAAGGAAIRWVAMGLDLGDLRRATWERRIELWTGQGGGVRIVSQSLPLVDVEAGHSLALDGLAKGGGPLQWLCLHPRTDDAPSEGADTPKGFEPSLASPGRPNPACGVALCEEGGEVRGARWPEPGDLAVREVLADPTGSDMGAEWLEVSVASQGGIDLNGLQLWIGDNESAAEFSASLAAQQCASVEPGQWVSIPITTERVALGFSATSAFPNSKPFTLKLVSPLGDEIARASVPEARSKGAWAVMPSFRGAHPTEDDFCPSAVRDGFEGSPGCPNSCVGDASPSCQ